MVCAQAMEFPFIYAHLLLFFLHCSTSFTLLLTACLQTRQLGSSSFKLSTLIACQSFSCIGPVHQRGGPRRCEHLAPCTHDQAAWVLRFVSSAYMLCILIHLSPSSLVTLSLHLVWRIRLRLRRWKEAIKPSFMTGVGYSELMVIKKCVHCTCFIDANLYVDGQLPVGPSLFG